MKVGFIGLGSMGYGQAMLLAKSTHDVAVFDVFPAAMTRFDGVARQASSIADVASDADVVGVCVRDDAQVNECAEQLIPAMKADSVLLIHSTVNPKTMIALAERGAERNIHVLDAAVTRTIIAQDAPFVFCMLGGDEGIAERVKPVLDAYSTDTVHAGPIGAGMAMKIANNLVSWSQIMIGLEAFELAEAAGVDTDKLLTVMTKNGVLTPPMGGFIKLRASRDKKETADLVASQSPVGEKDLSLAEHVGAGAGVSTPIGTFIRGFIQKKLNDMVGR